MGQSALRIAARRHGARYCGRVDFGFRLAGQSDRCHFRAYCRFAGLCRLLPGRRAAFGTDCRWAYYVALPLIAAQFLRLDPLGMFVIGYILLSVWAVDIFAMFSGKLIGGPKLAPIISPKKTWAGLFGGMVGAALARYVLPDGCRFWIW